MSYLPYFEPPLCDNSQHPAGLSRKMIYLQTKDHAHVFGCQACQVCKDVARKPKERSVPDYFANSVWVPCQKCAGIGYLPDEPGRQADPTDEPCNACHSSGGHYERKEIGA
jgi:DnaJ-class molecular chaperone